MLFVESDCCCCPPDITTEVAAPPDRAGAASTPAPGIAIQLLERVRLPPPPAALSEGGGRLEPARRCAMSSVTPGQTSSARWPTGQQRCVG